MIYYMQMNSLYKIMLSSFETFKNMDAIMKEVRLDIIRGMLVHGLNGFELMASALDALALA